MTSGFIEIYDGTAGNAALIAEHNSNITIIWQNASEFVTTSTAGKTSVEGSGGTLTMRNRTGAEANYRVWIRKLN